MNSLNKMIKKLRDTGLLSYEVQVNAFGETTYSVVYKSAWNIECYARSNSFQEAITQIYNAVQLILSNDPDA